MAGKSQQSGPARELGGPVTTRADLLFSVVVLAAAAVVLGAAVLL